MVTLQARVTAALFAVLALTLVVPFAQDAKAAVGEENKITCMYPTWVGYGPIHVANELGFFKDEGITVEETIDDDMSNAMAAMERGDIDCYLRTVGEFQGLGRRKTTQGIIIGTIDLSLGGDGWAADGSIKTVCDLKGKTIAVEPNLPARSVKAHDLHLVTGVERVGRREVGHHGVVGQLLVELPADEGGNQRQDHDQRSDDDRGPGHLGHPDVADVKDGAQFWLLPPRRYRPSRPG